MHHIIALFKRLQFCSKVNICCGMFFEKIRWNITFTGHFCCCHQLLVEFEKRNWKPFDLDKLTSQAQTHMESPGLIFILVLKHTKVQSLLLHHQSTSVNNNLNIPYLLFGMKPKRRSFVQSLGTNWAFTFPLAVFVSVLRLLLL